MVSVIVPVYNVEPYLNQCIDSILTQTYKDLEIILIDDGSTDRCGEICDSYDDPRITVYHTENQGLSAARNLGIAKSHGEYLFFIDSDDWIDQRAIQQAAERIGDADILCFEKVEGMYNGLEAMCAYLNGFIDRAAWGKLFRKSCFDTICFPEGHIAEDYAIMHRLLYKSNLVICSNISGYYYRDRKGSITHIHNEQNISDFYLAVVDQYEFCSQVLEENFNKLNSVQFDEVNCNLLKARAIAIIRAWAWKCNETSNNKLDYKKLSKEAESLFPNRVRKHFPLRIRGGLFLARFNCPCSYWIAHVSHVLTRRNRLLKILRRFNRDEKR